MFTTSLRSLTWFTMTASLLSAVMLGLAENGLQDTPRRTPGVSASRIAIPSDPTRAGVPHRRERARAGAPSGGSSGSR